MALRDILELGNPILRKQSRQVKTVDDYINRLLDDMLETMRKANGLGLAAPQIGVLRRVVVIEHEDEVYELINPEIVFQEGENIGVEACLSVPGRAGMVNRPETVVIRAMDREGKHREYKGEGQLARAFCHELDHLDGKIYTDLMLEEVDLDELDDEESID